MVKNLNYDSEYLIIVGTVYVAGGRADSQPQ